MAAWVREEKMYPVLENQRRKREAQEADKVEAAPGVTVGSLMRRLRVALIGPIHYAGTFNVPTSYQ